jgi:hypothetical protein
MVTRHARLRPSCARLYPALDGGRWYRVAGEEPEPAGLWLEDAGGDPFVTAGRRFVPLAHFEIREE